MPKNQEFLEDPIIATEVNQASQPKVMQQAHVDHIVYFSAIMISKAFFFVLLRYLYMSMNNMNEKKLLFEDSWASMTLLVVYFGLIFMMHVSLPQISRAFSNALIGSVFLIELIFLMLTEFSNIIVISATCIILFYTYAIYHIKKNQAYSKENLMLAAIVIFIGGLIALELTSKTYIKNTYNGYLKVNLFLASLVFCLWSALYFQDAENFESVDPICTTFIFVLDSFILISKVYEQVKEEFYIYEREDKESDLVIDKPLE